MKYKGTKRQAVWTHNSFIGHAVMMQSPTVGPIAARLADEIYSKAYALEQALRAERKDT